VTSSPTAPVPPATTADAALAAIAQRRLALKDARKRFLALGDPDALHDLRVALRRLRAAVDLFDVAIVLPRRARSDRLRRLGRRLARLRDADVLWGALGSEAAAAAGVDAALLERLDGDRLDALDRAERALRRRRTRRLLRALSRWERKPRFAVSPEDVAGVALPPRLLASAEALAAHPAWALKIRRDAAGRLEDAERGVDREGLHDALHQLRRRAKRMRYECEIAGPVLGRDETAAVDYLRAIQDALGELQDIRIIEAGLDRLAPADRPGQEFEHWLRDRRYEALERWRRLRRERGAPVLAFAAAPALPGAD
jgi:CHAD domain-containing protein